MPHERPRFAAARIEKAASFWPVVGVTGLRQVGKSTLLRQQLRLRNYLTLDDDDQRSEAEASPKAFLSKKKPPLVIDEVQKVGALFDAVKSAVDRKQKPGTYYLTGSSAFSAGKDVKESLTGRIGMVHLYPLTLAEGRGLPFEVSRLSPLHGQKPRFTTEMFSAALAPGGMPVPMFVRDAGVRAEYWKNWLATTLGRDLARVFGKGYDPDVAERLLHELVRRHAEGVWSDVSSFSLDPRRVRRYFQAFRDVFLVRRQPLHPAGTGRDTYWLADSGMLHALSPKSGGVALTETMARLRITGEILAGCEYAGKDEALPFFKSRKGTPVDLVWEGIPVKIVSTLKGLGWAERAVEGAMKKLGVDRGLLVGPTDTVDLTRKGEIGLVPWTYWS